MNRTLPLLLLAACQGGSLSSDAPLAALPGAAVPDARSFAAKDGGFELGVLGRTVRVDNHGFSADGVGLTTVALGDTALAPVGFVEGACWGDPCAPRLEARRPGLTEWWHGRAGEVEHGWDVAAPTGPDGLRIVVQARALRVVDAVNAIELFGAGGQVWRYSGLRAWDADGVALDGQMTLDGDHIVITVDDAGARYPVVVDPVASTATQTWDGESAHSELGSTLGPAGDVNGDGQADLLIGDQRYASYTGRVYVHHGSGTALSTTADTVLDPTDTEEFFGASVSGVGDVNNDGYDDVAVGAPGYSAFTGQVYLYLGSASGVSTTAWAMLTGEAENGYYGAAITGLGDITGDGYADFAVGAYGYNDYSGRVYVYAGGASGPTLQETLDAEGTYEYFGRALAGGGDGDSDGRPDLLVSAYRYAAFTGRVYLFRGTASGLAATAAETIDGETKSTYFGTGLAWAGDVNGDGRDDALVGASGAEAYTGHAYVFLGASGGLDASSAIMLEGTNMGDLFGGSVTGVGDTNADGLSDIAVGSHGFDNYRGRAYVYAGTAAGVYTAPSTVLTGEEDSYFGYAMTSVGDVTGDGYSDLVVSAPTYNDHAGQVRLYPGFADNDGDGIAGDSDCDDNNPFIHPGADEQPGDGVDEDCDGMEECYVDADDDGFRVDNTSVVLSSNLACDGPGEATLAEGSGDCDDTDPTRHPMLIETPADGIDQNCDGLENCYQDVDQDGYSGAQTVETTDYTCTSPGLLAEPSAERDCADLDAAVYPGAPDTPGDGIDSDCDGTETCWVDGDDDGYRASDDTVESDDGDCADHGETTSDAPSGDCNDADDRFYPGAPGESCEDPNDYNCDNQVEFTDADGDGTATCVDCDDGDAARSLTAVEMCNGVDDNCNGATDEGAAYDAPPWHADADGDGYPSKSDKVWACAQPDGYLEGGEWDCDDTNPAIHPDADESKNDGVDSNCDKEDNPSGCGCTSSGDGRVGLLAGLVAGVLALRRRR